MWRVYGCKRETDFSLSMINCLDESTLETSTSGERYVLYHLCSVSRLLNQCHGGCLFPFLLVEHVARSVCVQWKEFSVMSS